MVTGSYNDPALSQATSMLGEKGGFVIIGLTGLK